ncbi:tRNA dimethylallyltransferase isoform X2 [Anopheles coustani]|uniref:tRNA dimethylallyltransferase isoform X2 n=1 Tax=Anopheles coustani TaxID=139045 RepID=UPI00265ABD20|nr:tRNA dimethylallyltransferase isoform X2 [Anopheles coustani]
MRYMIRCPRILLWSGKLFVAGGKFSRVSTSFLYQQQNHRVPMETGTVPPIVVILGSTGTGKTKLSLQLAAQYGGEVISADSMQVYKGLDIVTAKATKAEQQQATHHLLDVVTPDQVFTVTHFREKALPIIDRLLEENRMPIVVGGTNYYIESILWKVLISDGVQRERPRKRRISPDSAPSTIKPSGGAAPSELEALSYDSVLLHQALKRVDPEAANRLHPNNKRKILRALEVYVESGGRCTISQKLKDQRTAPGACSLGGPLRYHNVVILWLQCNQQPLNERLDTRVDGMVAQGLLPEIRAFYESYVQPYDNCDYHRGILQSIGFKEFVKYLQQYDADKDRELMKYLATGQETDIVQPNPDGLSLLNDCLAYLKLVTRRYSRRQLQWINNRFLCDSDREVPPIYALDTSDVSLWIPKVLDRARTIVDAVMAGREPPYPCVPKIVNPRDRLQEEKTFRCESCQRVIIGEFQWRIHMRSKKHQKRAKSVREQQL